ncbi:MAG TPA: ATP-binding protein [Crinalium sp.]
MVLTDRRQQDAQSTPAFKVFNWVKWNSFHSKLLVTYLLLTAFGTLLMAGYILWAFQSYFIRTRQADLNDWTAALSESIADALEEGDLNQVNVIAQRFGAAETVKLRVFATNGTLIASSDPGDRQIKNWLQFPGMKEAFNQQISQGIAKGILSRDDRLYITRPIFRNGQFLGVVRMSITLQQFQNQFTKLVWAVFGALILTVLLCAVISDRLARSLAKPIQIMCNFATQLGSGQFGDKLHIRQSNELDQLATELNRMSERLALLDQERRAFLANVSHELRTPISNVQVTVEALRSGADEELELRDRFFQTIEDEISRLAQLIHDLLDLGRLEAGVTHLEKQRTALPKLIDRAVRAVEPRMKADSISVELDVDPVKLQGDPERLLQAFLNILDNAIKHSSPHSKIFVSGHRLGRQVVITFRDQGAGISETVLPRIFEQFYTADPSRKGRGAGLGLAITQRIVEAHGGSITVASTVGKGTTFTICLPVMGSDRPNS